MWMAGAGVKPGVDFGDTDELGYAANKEHKVSHSDYPRDDSASRRAGLQENTFSYEGP
jgi:hypothetical protein